MHITTVYAQAKQQVMNVNPPYSHLTCKPVFHSQIISRVYLIFRTISIFSKISMNVTCIGNRMKSPQASQRPGRAGERRGAEGVPLGSYDPGTQTRPHRMPVPCRGPHKGRVCRARCAPVDPLLPQSVLLSQVGLAVVWTTWRHPPRRPQRPGLSAAFGSSWNIILVPFFYSSLSLCLIKLGAQKGNHGAEVMEQGQSWGGPGHPTRVWFLDEFSSSVFPGLVLSPHTQKPLVPSHHWCHCLQQVPVQVAFQCPCLSIW